MVGSWYWMVGRPGKEAKPNARNVIKDGVETPALGMETAGVRWCGDV